MEMTDKQWQSMHKKFKTDFISMVMGYKHERLSSFELINLMEVYCEESYKIGYKVGYKKVKGE
jgi:hypothetical protein